MKLIVGLGNPGKEYERTRHNVGWLFLDTLTPDEHWQSSKKVRALFLKTDLSGKRVELLKPTTYMNDSGEAVAYALKNHSLSPNDLIVIHDDIDIPLGETRVQTNRGPAGHNGVKSIIEVLGTKDFTRIRIGVGPTDHPIADTANFVLGRLTGEEQKTLHTVFENVKKELDVLVNK